MKENLRKIFNDNIFKVVLSNPINSKVEYKKQIIIFKNSYYQIERYTDKQVFHKNLAIEEIEFYCENELKENYMQLNAFSDTKEYYLKVSKKGKILYGENRIAFVSKKNKLLSHNKKKNYILKENEIVEPLIDMGVITRDGKIVNSMYDKYKQINKFLEIIDDTLKNNKMNNLNVVDFGCGKSYLTFILYYYLTEIKKINVNIIGLDLKEDVINKCNIAAEKYGYKNLKFELGDINGYKPTTNIDMVITLHACDVATDYALFNAINWEAKMIFSVPCCQHELNKQMQTDNLKILSRYGVIKERFSALTTDAIRGNLLQYCGYKTQLLEFIDFENTPKNILIRAVKSNISKEHKEIVLDEVYKMVDEFSLQPKLLKLLTKNNL